MRSKQQIQREARAIMSEFSDAYPVLKNLPIRVSGRMTRAAGKAVWKRSVPYEIVLSLPFFADEKNDLRRTVIHEAAHIVAGHAAGHGPAWRAVHRAMGGKAERCHTMSLAEGFTARRDTHPKQLTETPCGCGCGQSMRLGPTQLKRHRAGARYVLKGHRAPRVRNDDLGPEALRRLLKF